MTGEELLKKLQAMTPEQLTAVVRTEGCDCDGFAEDVFLENEYENGIQSVIYISREGT